MDGTIINNPIAWAHFKVRGGWRNHFWGTGAYFLIIVAVITVTTRLSPGGAGVLRGWTTALLGLQLAVLVLYGCAVIGNAIRRDITTGVLESHRLMPVSSAAAVLGYLTGPSFQAIGLGIINLLVGTATATYSGIPVDRWFMCNAIIAIFVLFLWVCVTFASFVAKNAYVMLFGLLVSSVLNGGSIISIVPALTVLITPISGGSVFSLFSLASAVSPGYPWAFLAQFVFGAIFFRGAMRRYRRDDVPALGQLLGLLLLATWVGTSVLAMVHWDRFRPVMTYTGPDDPSAKVIATLLSSMLIALAPIGASARATVDWMRTLVTTGRTRDRRPLPPPLLAGLAAAITLYSVIAAPPQKTSSAETLLRVGIVLLAFYLSMTYLLRIFYRAGRKAALIGAVWIILTWLIPLGIDALLHVTLLPTENPPPLFALASPIGEFIDIWSPTPTHSNFGLIAQLLLATLPAAIFYATEPKHPTQPKPMHNPQPSS